MASVKSFTAGRSFVYTFYKRLNANPAIKWVNTYEAISKASGTLTDLIALGQALENFEKTVHPSSVYLVKWEVRTGARDSVPYNPDTFYESPINAPGESTHSVSNDLDVQVALWADRAVLTGRSGRLYYRGVIGETDVHSESGTFTLDTGARTALETVFAAANTHIVDYLATGTNPVLQLVIIGKNGEYPRPLIVIWVNGVAIVRKFRKFFNRTGAQALPPFNGVVDVSGIEDYNTLVSSAGMQFVPPEGPPPD